MNESPAWLRLLMEVSAQEAAADAVVALDVALSAGQGAQSREGFREYQRRRADLARKAGL